MRLREEEHMFFGEAFVVPRDERNLIERIERATSEVCKLDWRLQDFTIVPVRQISSDRRVAQPSHLAA